MLEGLASIDWEKLEDAYGPADGVADRIRSLASGDERWEKSLEELISGILHQGTHYSATAPAVPFLIEILDGPPVHTKQAIIELLAAMTSAHDDEVEGYGPGVFRSQPGPPDYPEAIATTEAIARGSELYCRLLADDDPSIRASVAYLIAGVPASWDSARELLRARVGEEPDPGVRAGMLLALARMPDGDEVFRSFFADPSPTVRGAAAVAAAAVSGPTDGPTDGPADGQVTGLLVEAA